MEKIVQTAGRDALGEFAPAFARYNDDILFGENWNDPCIDHKLRCIITLVALVSAGVTDSSLQYHLENAKRAGVTREEIAGVITHSLLRRVAQSLGGIFPGEGGMDFSRGSNRSHGSPRRPNVLPHWPAQRWVCPIFLRAKLFGSHIYRPDPHL